MLHRLIFLKSIFSTLAQSWQLFMEWMRLLLIKITKVTRDV